MNDQSALTFYKLCSDCNLPGLIDTFGDLPNTTNMALLIDLIYTRECSNHRHIHLD